MGKIRSEKRKLNIVSSLGIFASFLLVTTLSIYLYSPTVKTHAKDFGQSSYENVQVGVLIDPHIGIGVDKDLLNMFAVPGEFVSGPVDVYVITNSYLGHTLTIEDKDANTNLVHANTSITDHFSSSFEGSKTGSTMDSGEWGFSIDGTKYYKVPVRGKSTLINKTGAASPSNPGYDTKTVNFGAKVGMNETAGTYSDVVLFTAYVNTQDGNVYDVVDGEKVRVPIYKLGGTTKNMQNFDCELMEIGQIVNTTDLRDGNVYSIGRLPDGLCWMRQNLRLTNYTLTPDDSNVTSNFVLKNSNISDFSASEQNPDPLNNAVYYDNDTGAYYSWYAATAGSLDEMLAEDDQFTSYARSSVCPKEWRLPSDYDFDYVAKIVNPNSGGGSARSWPSYVYLPYEYPLLNLMPTGTAYNGTFYSSATEGDIWTSNINRSISWNTTVYTDTSTIHTSSEEEQSNALYGVEIYGQGLPVRCVTGTPIIVETAEEEIVF